MRKKVVIAGEIGFIIGAITDAFGINMVIKAGFGLSPVVSFQHIVSSVFPFLSFGTWSYIIQISAMVIMVAIIKRREKSYLVFVFLSVMFGYLIDFEAFLCRDWPINFEMRILYFIMGMLMLAVGIAFFMVCNMPLLPIEYMIREVSAFMGIRNGTFKTGMDIICVLLTIIIALCRFGSLLDFGIGTIISALCLGVIIDISQRIIERYIVFKPKYNMAKGKG